MIQPISQQDNELRLRLYIQPRASRDQWMGIHGDELKVAITAPPVDGAANQYLQRWLAKQFGVSLRDITLLKGQSSRHKQFEIKDAKNIPPELVQLIANAKADD